MKRESDNVWKFDFKRQDSLCFHWIKQSDWKFHVPPKPRENLKEPLDWLRDGERWKSPKKLHRLIHSFPPNNLTFYQAKKYFINHSNLFPFQSVQLLFLFWPAPRSIFRELYQLHGWNCIQSTNWFFQSQNLSSEWIQRYFYKVPKAEILLQFDIHRSTRVDTFIIQLEGFFHYMHTSFVGQLKFFLNILLHIRPFKVVFSRSIQQGRPFDRVFFLNKRTPTYTYSRIINSKVLMRSIILMIAPRVFQWKIQQVHGQRLNDQSYWSMIRKPLRIKCERENKINQSWINFNVDIEKNFAGLRIKRVQMIHSFIREYFIPRNS